MGALFHFLNILDYACKKRISHSLKQSNMRPSSLDHKTDEKLITSGLWEKVKRLFILSNKACSTLIVLFSKGMLQLSLESYRSPCHFEIFIVYQILVCDLSTLSRFQYKNINKKHKFSVSIADSRDEQLNFSACFDQIKCAEVQSNIVGRRIFGCL